MKKFITRMLSGITRTKHNPSPLLLAIAQSRPEAGWNCGWTSAVDSNGRTIFIADAHHEGNQRFIVRADEKLTAFLELKSAIRACDDLA
jgi:hypothetical protein